MKPCPMIAGRHLLGAIAVIAGYSDTYARIDVEHKNFRNYWVVDRADIMQWDDKGINIKLYARDHKYRVVSKQHIMNVKHIVPKKNHNKIVKLWRKLLKKLKHISTADHT